MRRFTILAAAMLTASPALAASGPFFSLHNTNFVVLVAFVLFAGFLVWKKVPGLIGGLLDKRAAAIRNELDEARALREEAKSILASYERKAREVQEQSDRIVATAKEEALATAARAKEELKASIARRLKAAEEQIASAEAAALREVRERAATLAVAVAGEVLSSQMTVARAKASIDAAIAEVGERLH